MVIQQGGALVKAACMPRIAKQLLAVQVMAKLVAKGVQEGAKRRYLFADGGPHPETDDKACGIVVPKKLRRPTCLTDLQGTGGKHPDGRLANTIEGGCPR